MHLPWSAKSQSIECGTTIPPDAYQIFVEEQPAITAFVAAHATQGMQMQDVPVRFTTVQGSGSGFGFGNFEADFTINTLNTVYAPAGLHFIRCGEITNIFDDRIKISDDIDQFTSLFSYTSGAVEVYLKNNYINLNTPPVAIIPITAYYSVNPSWNFDYPEHNNWIRLIGADLGVTFIHEMGHHFGLFHTFENASVDYHVPLPGELPKFDYPYQVMGQNGQVIPEWWGRELVTRVNYQPNDPKQFKTINWNIAGDLNADTPADCSPKSPQVWPGCPLSSQNLATCAFNALLTYTDYNGDPIYPPPSGLSLGRNFMSYWNQSCLNSFTPDQYSRVAFYNETARQPHYASNRCGTFTGKVELEGTSTPIHNVTLRVRHPGDARICNVTTSLTGEFSGILHTDDLQVYAYHHGKKSDLAFVNDKLRMHYEHTKCEWKKGVDAIDLNLITLHNLGIQPLANGYRVIAGDATLDNHISVLDVVMLRKMLLVDTFYIPGVDQPWHFIPEFIPQEMAAAFNLDPFHLLGGAYLNQGWLYTAPASNKRGYDAIKIGDVNFSWLTDSTNCMSEEPPGPITTNGILPFFAVPSLPLAQNQVVKFAFKVQNFQQISAFQLGINVPYDLFEVQDVVDLSIPSYTKEDYFGLADMQSNAVRTLWYSETGTPLTLPNDTKLFSLVVKAKQAIPNLHSVLALDNAVLKNFFHGISSSPTTLSVAVEPLNNDRSDDAGGYSRISVDILRCDPNPITGSAILHFMNKEKAPQADITIINTLGIKVYSLNLPLAPDENRIQLDGLSDLPRGVYWLTIHLADNSYSQKIIKN